MELYNVGTEDIAEDIRSRLNVAKYEWVVYWYETGDYEGNGEAVGLRADGCLDYFNLSHCSCYGPEEGLLSPKPVTAEEFFRPHEDHWDNHYERLRPKSRELLSRGKGEAAKIETLWARMGELVAEGNRAKDMKTLETLSEEYGTVQSEMFTLIRQRAERLGLSPFDKAVWAGINAKGKD